MTTEASEPGALNGSDGGKPEAVAEDRAPLPTEAWAAQLAPRPPDLPVPTLPSPQATSARRDAPFPGPSSSQSLPVQSPQPTPQMKQLDEIYCSSCGRAIKMQAVICVHCGVPVPGRSLTVGAARPKSKTAAVLLAVFLTFWTWCYTYKRDAWKFWLNLVFSIVTLGIWAITVAWVWAILDAAIKPTEYYEQFPNYRS
jgi:cation transport ATPase